MKKITNYFLLLILLFLMLGNSVNVIAQDCKFDIEEKDAFSESSIKGFKYKASMNYSIIHYFILEENGDFKIKLDLVRTGLIKDNILKDKSTIELKLSNGEVVSAKCIDNALPVIDNYKGTTTYEAYYQLNKKDIQAIVNSAPTAIRLTAIPEIDFSDDIKKRRGAKMSEELKCLIK